MTDEQTQDPAANPLAGVDFADDAAAEEAIRLGITAEDLAGAEGPVTVEAVREAHSAVLADEVKSAAAAMDEPYDGPELDGDETPEPEDAEAPVVEGFEDTREGRAVPSFDTPEADTGTQIEQNTETGEVREVFESDGEPVHGAEYYDPDPQPVPDMPPPAAAGSLAESSEDKLNGLVGAIREYFKAVHGGTEVTLTAVADMGNARDAALAQAALDALA